MNRKTLLIAATLFSTSLAALSYASEQANVSTGSGLGPATASAETSQLYEVWYRFPNTRWRLYGRYRLRDAYAVADSLAARGAQVDIVPERLPF